MTARECVVNRIIELCAMKRMNINSLAYYAGIPPTTVKSIIYGASKNPGIVTIKIICDGLGISLTEFFDTDEFRALEQEIV